jgi:ATP-dependent DNA helicase RecG
MQPTIHNLIKFCQLEISRNYTNSAVIGGFENMLNVWVPDAKKQNVPLDLITQVESLLKNYDYYPLEKRVETIQNLLTILNKPEFLQSESSTISKKLTSPHPQMDQQSYTIKTTSQVISTPTEKSNQKTIQVQTTEKPIPNTKISFLDPKTGLGAPLQTIPNVGPAKSKALSKIGLLTLEDLLYYFPRKYEDYSLLLPINRIEYNQKVTIIGSVKSIHTRSAKNNKVKITELILEDGTGTLRITFFNQPFLHKRLFKGAQIVVSGKTEMYLGRLAMNNPYWERLDQKNLFTNRIVPIYKLTKNITQNWLRKVMDHTVSQWAPRVPDYFPTSLIKEADLLDLSKAIYEVHNPETFELLARAQQRISFDEIFFLQLGVLQQRRNWQKATSTVFKVTNEWLDRIYQKLPYQLTNAQLKTINDIRNDFIKGIPMSRLVQGDVGSGKTMVAAIAAAIATQNGDTQAALMAPTSILAEQHYTNLMDFFTEQGLLHSHQIRLLIGSTPNAEKEEIRQSLKNGIIKVIIGTHALLEDPIEFNNLEFVVIDEQHRFGVTQRSILRDKGNSPHILVMTATPIPRSLALTVYGDLDISVMDEMPPGRKPVSTHIVNPLDRARVYQLIHNQLAEGRQAFIVYPLVSSEEIEDSDDTDQITNAAVNEHARLQNETFTANKVGLLHGKMRPEEKDHIMKAFKDKKIDILVSTTVVEVGVDIPNASVMLIEGANRFGLAQLHQLRGRVGRGNHKSYCLLIPENEDAVENERLKVMQETNDGFILAEKDLAQRGPGDFLGNRQSGYMDLRLANMIEKARAFAQNIFEKDPDLNAEEHQEIKHILNHYWKTGTGDIS